MKVKKYMLLSHEGVHEYNMFVEKSKKGIKYSLHTSDNECWSSYYRNELVIEMFDNGNDGVKFSKMKNEMGYDELECLRLIINFEFELDKPNSKYKYTVANVTNIKL